MCAWRPIGVSPPSPSRAMSMTSAPSGRTATGRRRPPRLHCSAWPGGADRLLPVARAELEAAAVRFVRTHRHPAVADLEHEGLRFESFDDAYDVAVDLDAAYGMMADRLLRSATEHGRVVYAVPGS